MITVIVIVITIIIFDRYSKFISLISYLPVIDFYICLLIKYSKTSPSFDRFCCGIVFYVSYSHTDMPVLCSERFLSVWHLSSERQWSKVYISRGGGNSSLSRNLRLTTMDRQNTILLFYSVLVIVYGI
jgi:hypothetical protein